MRRESTREIADLTDCKTEVMVHVTYPEVLELLRDLYEYPILDHWGISIEPPFTACEVVGNGRIKIPSGRQLCVRFDNRCGTDNWKYYLISFCAVLREAKFVSEIVIKSGETGYLLGDKGTFTEEWDLDDGMC